MTTKPTLLIVGDSPTVSTGFADVISNLASRWRSRCNRVDIWGINYNGWPHDLPYRIFPAGYGDWNSHQKLEQLLRLIGAGDYTHVFILCDCHNLSGGNFSQVLRDLCDKKKIHITFYYPVDAALEPEWLETVDVADLAVTYTEYGHEKTRLVRPDIDPEVLGHGVDASTFYPLENRDSLRAERLNGFAASDDFLIVNVNRNEKRKAPHHSLEILQYLKLITGSRRFKLLLHMPRLSPHELTDLESIGAQLGLEYGKDWMHNDGSFVNGNARMTKEALNELYNVADLVLSTSLGEGWGLSITEAAAAGCPVAVPDHTACGEIVRKFWDLNQPQIFLLPVSFQCIVNPLDSSRVRYPVDTHQAADCIWAFVRDGNADPHCTVNGRYILNDDVRKWLSWDRIADEFFSLMTQ